MTPEGPSVRGRQVRPDQSLDLGLGRGYREVWRGQKPWELVATPTPRAPNPQLQVATEGA